MTGAGSVQAGLAQAHQGRAAMSTRDGAAVVNIVTGETLRVSGGLALSV
jgi:hypothetical protein